MNINRAWRHYPLPPQAILGYRAETPVTAVEITERFDISKLALSKHLKVLEHAGLVVYEKKG